ncbi:hypothetical protein P7K49_016807, partial [Saguinus oedipus]
PLVPVSGEFAWRGGGVLPGRPGGSATTCAARCGGPCLRLCAPPKTLRTLHPPPARFP